MFAESLVDINGGTHILETTDAILNQINEPSVEEIVVEMMTDGMFCPKVERNHMVSFYQMGAEVTFTRLHELFALEAPTRLVSRWWGTVPRSLWVCGGNSF